MKLERIPEYITVTIVMALGIALALFCGSLIGGGKYNNLAIFAISVVLIVFAIKVRENIWMIIPIFWPLIGRLTVLPVPFSVNELAVMYVFFIFLGLKAVKVIKYRPTFGWMDFVFFFNFLYLASVFVRNPVGVEAFGADRVGGKPYFEAFVGFLSYWCLSRATATPKQARYIPFLTVIPVTIVSILGLVAMFVPTTALVFNQIYSGITESIILPGASIVGPEEGDRFICFRDFSKYGMIALCSYFIPVTLFIPIYFWRFCAFLTFTVTLLLSGFRSFVMYSGAMVFLGSYFRKGWRAAFMLVAVFVLVLIPLVFGQGRVFKLPTQMQRALSFIPGKWDEDATAEAKGSTDWRIGMWKQVLSTDKYIQDKWLGDGFGMTRRQYESIMSSLYSEGLSDEITQETAMITGDYHSGPISTIHVVGAVGLVFTYVLLIGLAIRAWNLILKARATPYFVLALFIGMPVVFEPFFFTLIFGGYSHVLPFAGFSLGMLKLIDHSISVHLDQQKRTPSEPVPQEKNRFRELDDRRGALVKTT